MAGKIDVFLVSYYLPNSDIRVVWGESLSRKRAKRLRKKLRRQGCEPIIHRFACCPWSLVASASSSQRVLV